MSILVIKSGTTSIAGGTVKGDFTYFSATTKALGGTIDTGFWSGVDPTCDGYTVYKIGGQHGWAAMVATGREQLNYYLKLFGGTGTTTDENVTWATNANNIFLHSGSTGPCPTLTPTPTGTPSSVTPTPTPTPTPTSTPTGGSIATFDGDFILCVQAGATLDFRAQDGSATSGHFTTTAYITAGNCSGPVNVTGTLTSAQGPFKISVPAITSPSTNTAVIVAQAIGATNATVTTAVESGVLKIIITPNSYPSTVTLSGTLTVTFP